jgi:hypothetical protein
MYLLYIWCSKVIFFPIEIFSRTADGGLVLKNGLPEITLLNDKVKQHPIWKVQKLWDAICTEKLLKQITVGQ